MAKKKTNSLEIRKDVVGGIILIFVGAIWWIIQTQYFNKNIENEKYIVSKHKKLYEEGSNHFKNIHNSYQDIANLLRNNYGATPNEYKQTFEKFNKSINQFEIYQEKIERYSYDKFINSTENISTITQGDLQLIWLYQKSSESLRDNIAKILYKENPNKVPKASNELIQKILKASETDLTEFINYENKLYFKLINFSLPLINGLENDFNKNFRDILNLGTTKKLEQKLSEIPKLILNWKNYTYEDKNYPFSVASFRTYAAPELKMEGDLFQYKDDNIKAYILLKFIMSASIDIY